MPGYNNNMPGYNNHQMSLCSINNARARVRAYTTPVARAQPTLRSHQRPQEPRPHRTHPNPQPTRTSPAHAKPAPATTPTAHHVSCATRAPVVPSRRVDKSTNL